MAIPLNINGAVFEYPQNFDEDWGVDATGWAQAVTNGALYLSGGNFPLTAAVDFGSSFGMSVKSITSKTTTPATAGYLRLAKTDAIEWRNNLGDGNLALTIDGSNMLSFNGSPLGLTSLTNSQIYVGNASNVPVSVAMSGDATIANTGALTIANSAITNAKVSASAAIALTKLAAQTASRAAVFDSSGLLVPATTTSTQIGYLSTTTSDVQTQLDARLPLAGGTMSGAINMASNKITSLMFGSSTGDAAAFGQLKVIQWQVGITTTQFSTTSNAFQTTNLSVNITPSSASSHVLVLVSGDFRAAGSGGISAFATIAKGGTNIMGANGGCSASTGSSVGALVAPCSIFYVDSPASTSALTYAVQIRNSDNTTSVSFPAGNGNTITSILAVELA